MIKSLSFNDPYTRLIEKCLENNRLAQKKMYEKLSARMLPVCIRYIGEREKAEDVLHDGFITLFSKLGTYKGEGSFEGWARRIFINTALMYIRKNDILRDCDDLEKPGTDVRIAPSVLDKIGAEELMGLISKMPEGFRTVFNLYAVEGYSHQEIAEMLGITESGSRSQLSRARLWLKARLKRHNR
ncbi:MAG: sigma-70 family RNA polymerase sigma factor [Bacteroidales bacterium]|jgi:RNA polymerase sigma-70 factor (ECF subfamily)|nr:sigma-70 family RNA polymerase sigma factor [Bacteroidales bacterium]